MTLNYYWGYVAVYFQGCLWVYLPWFPFISGEGNGEGAGEGARLRSRPVGSVPVFGVFGTGVFSVLGVWCIWHRWVQGRG